MKNLRALDPGATVLAFETDQGETVTFPAADGNALWDQVKGDLSALQRPDPFELERHDAIAALRQATHEAVMRVSDPMGELQPSALLVYLLKTELLVTAHSVDPMAPEAKAILERNAQAEGATYEAHCDVIALKRTQWMDRIMRVDDEWLRGKQALQKAAGAEDMKREYDRALAAILSVGS